MKKITSSAYTSPTWHPYFDRVYELAHDAGYDMHLNGYKPSFVPIDKSISMPEITVEITNDFDNRPGVVAFWPTITFPDLGEHESGSFEYVISQWKRAGKLCDYLYEHLLVLSDWED